MCKPQQSIAWSRFSWIAGVSALVVSIAMVLGFMRSAVAVEAGWEPLPEGGLQYTIQVPPQLLPHLGEGEVIHSAVPPRIQGQVRAIRLTVGTEPLPKLDPSTGSGEATRHITRFGSTPLPVTDPFSRPPGPAGQRVATPLLQRPISSPPFAGSALSGRSPEEPEKLPGDAGTVPHAVSHVEPATHEESLPDPEPPVVEQSELPPDASEEDSSWMLLALAIAALGSLAGMFYTGTLAWEYRNRYLRLLKESLSSSDSSQ